MAAVIDDAPAVRNDCGERWSVSIDSGLAGSNNAYTWQCRPYSDSAAAGADTLVTRFSEAAPEPILEINRVYVESSADGRISVFVPGTAQALPDDTLTAIEALHTRGYYVSTASIGATASAPLPALRAKTLTSGPAGPRVSDIEVQPGIDDMQIEFGIDADAPDAPGYGEIDGFEPAKMPAAGERVLAVRIWLRVRSLWHEPDLPPQRLEGYADRAPRQFSDGFRRALAVTTIDIDSAREL